MSQGERRQDPAERLEESVRHALELVGPGEVGVEQVWDEDSLTEA
jgi:hypothetical protein